MLTLRTLSKNATTGTLQAGNLTFPCALGRSGCTGLKREGDGATPIGAWAILAVFYRADRIARPQTSLPLTIIRPYDGWCDDPQDRNYNRPVRLPYPASTETMWREDALYDLVVVLDYNITERSLGKGSAIFMHVAKEGFRPTEGCIALRPADLRKLLRICTPGTVVNI